MIASTDNAETRSELELLLEMAHNTGLALLLTTHRERAELYVEQFHSKKLTVTIEAAT